jgi:molybdopterin-guanine dinucleotide biosynthesis protein
MEHGKDTWQMLTSGATEVVWVRSKRSDLPVMLPKALKRLAHLDLIIVEGNSAIEFLKPDVVIFIFGKGRERWKPGIEELAAGADIIMNDSDVKLPADSQTKKFFPRSLSGAEYIDFFGTLSGLIHERRAEAGSDEQGS